MSALERPRSSSAREYADEARLAARIAAQRPLDRAGPAEVAFEAVAEAAPRRVLEVGCGRGELAERIARELGAERRRGRPVGADGRADAARGASRRASATSRSCRSRDATFDCVVAAWMLYHVPDLDRGARASSRACCAPTGGSSPSRTASDSLASSGSLVGVARSAPRRFSAENGEGRCCRHFTVVERRDVRGTRDVPRPRGRAPVRRRASPPARDLADRPAVLRRARCVASRHAVVFVAAAVIRPAELIERKRDGGELAAEEIRELVLGYTRDEVPDYQMAAFLMAVFFRGPDRRRDVRADRRDDRAAARRSTSAPRSGGRCVDKHSTGGVGDKTSIAVGPIVAACGVPFGKMSGRGLGHTGGTLDKLEAIPGYRVELDDRGVRRAGARDRARDHRPERGPRARPTSGSTRSAT